MIMSSSWGEIPNSSHGICTSMRGGEGSLVKCFAISMMLISWFCSTFSISMSWASIFPSASCTNSSSHFCLFSSSSSYFYFSSSTCYTISSSSSLFFSLFFPFLSVLSLASASSPLLAFFLLHASSLLPTIFSSFLLPWPPSKLLDFLWTYSSAPLLGYGKPSSCIWCSLEYTLLATFLLG